MLSLSITKHHNLFNDRYFFKSHVLFESPQVQAQEPLPAFRKIIITEKQNHRC